MTERQTTIKAWDQIAAQLILRELAPKGFKESNDKNYKGMKVANVHSHFLNHKKVGKCQQVSAQLVREFRGRVKAIIKIMMEEHKKFEEQAKSQRKECGFLQFRYKRILANAALLHKWIHESLDKILTELDYIDFK